jgi:hypothetical protein
MRGIDSVMFHPVEVVVVMASVLNPIGVPTKSHRINPKGVKQQSPGARSAPRVRTQNHLINPDGVEHPVMWNPVGVHA